MKTPQSGAVVAHDTGEGRNYLRADAGGFPVEEQNTGRIDPLGVDVGDAHADIVVDGV